MYLKLYKGNILQKALSITIIPVLILITLMQEASYLYLSYLIKELGYREYSKVKRRINITTSVLGYLHYLHLKLYFGKNPNKRLSLYKRSWNMYNSLVADVSSIKSHRYTHKDKDFIHTFSMISINTKAMGRLIKLYEKNN